MKKLSSTKLIALVSAFVLLSSAMLSPTRLEASIVVSTLSGGTATVGLILPFLAGASTTAAALEFFKIGLRTQGWRSVGSFTLSAFAAFTGFILLDSGDRRSVLFGSISLERAVALGLSYEQWRAYDENLPLLNALREETVERTLTYAQQNPQATDEDLLQELSSNWHKLSSESLDATAVLAAQKLTDQLIAQRF
ncbi:hypothetical protein EBZ37_03990 [bacterium]|nr:hypothetical protein [bacterium]